MTVTMTDRQCPDWCITHTPAGHVHLGQVVYIPTFGSSALLAQMFRFTGDESEARVMVNGQRVTPKQAEKFAREILAMLAEGGEL